VHYLKQTRNETVGCRLYMTTELFHKASLGVERTLSCSYCFCESGVYGAQKLVTTNTAYNILVILLTGICAGIHAFTLK